jgi:Domain of unknown function (DUF4962)
LESKNSKTNLFSIDNMTIAVAIFLFVFALFFLLKDDDGGEVGANAIPVGKFSEINNNVRRRTQSGFVWTNARNQETVFEGDSVFTDESSETSLNLNGIGNLKIGQKSLVVIRTKGHGLMFDLQYGNMTGKLNPGVPVYLMNKGEVQELKGDGEIRVETSADQEPIIQVVTGELTINKKGKNVTLNKAKIAELISPKNGKSLWLALGQEQVFSWRTPDKNTTSRFEIASDEHFEKIAYVVDTKETSVSVPLDKLPTGPIRWRVKQVASGTQTTPYLAKIYQDLPPLPSYPNDNQIFLFNPKKNEKGKTVDLSWTDKAGSTSYEVQLAADKELKKQVISKTLNTLTETTPLLTAGEYFWRVRGLNSDRTNPLWSAVYHFTVEEEVTDLQTPRLSNRQINYPVPVTSLRKLSPEAARSGTGFTPENLPPFSWDSVPNAQGYEVELAENDAFTNSIKLPVSPETQFSPNEVKPGPLYVRVRAVGKNGITSSPSEGGRLDVTLPGPHLKPIASETAVFSNAAELDKATHRFQLEWTPQPFAENYELNWGADENFEKSKKFRVKENQRTISVTQSGDYKVRIRSIGKNGIPLGPYSNVQTASFKKQLIALPLVKATPPPVRLPTNVPKSGSGPVLLEPKKSSSVVSVDDSTSFVNLRWQKIKEMRSYEIEIATDRDFASPLRYTTNLSSYTVKKDLPEGKIYWRVRGLNKEKKPSEWSEIFDLNILYQ